MKRRKNLSKSSCFSENEMKHAVLRVVKNNVPVNRAAKESGLCKKTLKSYVDRYLSASRCNKKLIRFKPSYEINQVFTNDLEALFENHLVTAHENQQKITREYIRQAAFEFATNCNVHVPKTWNVRKKGGLDWLYGFLNRHPAIKHIVTSYKKKCIYRSSNTLIDEVNDQSNNILNAITSKFEEKDASGSSDYEIDDVQNYNDDSSDELNKKKEEYFYSYLKVQDEKLQSPTTSYSCLTGISVKTPVDEFVENLTAACNAIAVENCVSSERVYNLGEIVLMVENPVSQMNRNEVVVTACCFVNAAGQSLPPFFVFPRKRLKKSVLDSFPEGVDGVARRSGMLDDDSFMQVLQHFQKSVKCTKYEKVILIMDDDEHHITINSLDFYSENGIEIVTLPPLYAQKLQPIDRYVFRMLKAYFSQACRNFRAANKKTIITVRDVTNLFCKIFPLVFTSEMIVTGFTKTGIYPLQEHLFTTDEFLSTESNKIHHECPVFLDYQVELTPCGISDSDDSADDEKVQPEASSDCSKKIMQCSTICTTPVDVSFTNESPLEEFFNHLVKGYSELNRYGGISSEKIYNLDEIELLVRNVSPTKSENRILRVTVCCYVNAAGSMLPPFFVYPNDEFHDEILEGGIENAKGTATTDGTLDSSIFLLLLQHFQQYAQATVSSRVMLIMDCEEHHISLGTISYCEENGIILLTVPPHISEPFQPLEKTVFKTFSKEFRRECAKWQEVDDDFEQCVTLNDVAMLFARASTVSFTSVNIIAGFELTGLWPLNKELFARDALCRTYTEMPIIENSERNEKFRKWIAVEPDEYVLTDSDDASSISNYDIEESNKKLDQTADLLEQENNIFPKERIFVVDQVPLIYCKVRAILFVLINAAGESLAPFLVYPPHVDGVPQQYFSGLVGCVAEEGVADEDMLVYVLRHLQQLTNSSERDQVLLFLKDYFVPGCERALRLCNELGIIPQTMPSSMFYPFENAILKPFKERFDKIFREGDNKKNYVHDLAVILDDINNDTCLPKKIAMAFKEFTLSLQNTLEQCGLPDRSFANSTSSTDIVSSEKNEIANLSNLKYDDLIIEEEIEVTLDDDTYMPEEDIEPKIKFLCKQCNTHYDTENRLLMHQRTHKLLLSFQSNRCRYCDLNCKSLTVRDKHEETHMKNNFHCCAFCDKQCASKAALVQHRRIHLKKS